jgi:hypothetical protein
MSEFLHDVVAKREQSAPPRYPAQYTPIYRSVFVRTIYHPLVVNHADMLDNIMYWVDSPEYRLLRVIFSSLECEHTGGCSTFQDVVVEHTFTSVCYASKNKHNL